jgi:hypothetical protein
MKPSAPRKIPGTHFSRMVDPRVIVQFEGLDPLKNPVTSSGIKPATFRLVAYCLHQLCYHVPHFDICNEFWSIFWKDACCGMTLINKSFILEHLMERPWKVGRATAHLVTFYV